MFQALVATRVANLIVVVFQVIEIDHDHQDRRGFSKRPWPLGPQEVLEVTVVGNLADAIEPSQPLQFMVCLAELGITVFDELRQCLYSILQRVVAAPVHEDAGEHRNQHHQAEHERLAQVGGCLRLALDRAANGQDRVPELQRVQGDRRGVGGGWGTSSRSTSRAALGPC